MTIMVNGRNKKWDKLTFKEMNEVLQRTPITNRRGAPFILTHKTKEEIDPLIIYRNFAAHGKKKIKKIEENAIRQLKIGFNVSKELCAIYR